MSFVRTNVSVAIIHSVGTTCKTRFRIKVDKEKLRIALEQKVLFVMLQANYAGCVRFYFEEERRPKTTCEYEAIVAK